MVWRFAADTNDLGVPITLLEAPSPEPDSSRATSADTFTFTAHTLGMQDSTCLLVTGQPFVPYQNFDALRTLALPFGIQVETVGFGIDRYDGLGEWTNNTLPSCCRRSARRSERPEPCWNGSRPASAWLPILGGDGAWRGRRVAARYGSQPSRWRPRP
ncbi:Hypothetical protein ERS031503_00807 [Mycobacterium tuberculosis]|nr:Hypothetical protein ERS031503_00807 [Mycobacterium tuberculosis]